MAFLRFQRQGRDGTRFQPAQADGIACVVAIAIGIILDPQQRGVDFRHQLALPVTRAQFQ